MSTNYYFHYNLCKCCHRYEEEHLGKSSVGWQFTHHSFSINLKFVDYAYTIADQDDIVEIDSWKKTKSFLKKYCNMKTIQIFDEYGTEIPCNEFISFVESLFNPSNKNHTDEVNENYFDRNTFKDSKGHSFIKGEFF